MLMNMYLILMFYFILSLYNPLTDSLELRLSWEAGSL
jgi:hypothetical protein